jgi:threonine aldolase
MAEILENSIRKIGGIEILFPRQANSVFVQLSRQAIDAMHERGWKFYTFIGQGGCRLMCAWDMTEEDVQAFAADLASVLR